MVGTESDFRKVLKRELESRCKTVPRYSLRAFARELSLSPSRVSEILSGKQGLSREKAGHIASVLGFSVREKELFCDLVESEHARAQVTRELAKTRLEKHRLDSKFHVLKDDVIQAIGEWYHFAILQLTQVKDFKSEPAWIARALGITVMEAQIALERLDRLGLIETKRGKIHLLKETVSLGEDVPSRVVRGLHKQVLEKAAAALETQSVEDRDFSAIFVAIDRKMMLQAKQWIKRFRRRLLTRIEQTDSKNEVYCFSTQFFSLTQPRDKDI
jgi:uncharacterized protein (TIGR02147 family)